MQTISGATTTKLSADTVRDYLEPCEFGLSADKFKQTLPEDTLCKLSLENTRDPYPGTEIFFCPAEVAQAYKTFIDRYGSRHGRFNLEFTRDPVIVAGHRASMSFTGNGNADTVVYLNRAIVSIFFAINELTLEGFIDIDDLWDLDSWWNIVPYLRLLGYLKSADSDR